MLIQELGNFLKETTYCNCNNPIIKDFAIKLCYKYSNEKDKAVMLFNYVRDNIPYKFDYWNLKASDTLKKGYGMCTNKNNLLIALLRSVNIPTGYGILRVKARDYFGEIMLDFFKNKIAEESIHIYTQVYINNKWIKCDPSTDKYLSEKTAYFNYSTELVLWDGYHDAMDKILPQHIISDTGPFYNIDDRLQKKPKNMNFIKMAAANMYLDFLRLQNSKFSDYKDREKKFLSWLLRRNPLFYLYFKLE